MGIENSASSDLDNYPDRSNTNYNYNYEYRRSNSSMTISQHRQNQLRKQKEMEKQDNAVVANVLNTVAEKMVNKVSHKAKLYLDQKSKTTEQKVITKMNSLENRLEKFNQILDQMQ